MTITKPETIRISIPRLPYPRPEREGYRADQWRAWLHAVKFYARLTIVDGQFFRRPMPFVEGPCAVNAMVRWNQDDPEAESHAKSRARGIVDALVRSGIATEIDVFLVGIELVPAERMGTDIEIEPLEDS